MKIIEEKGYNVSSMAKEAGIPYTTLRSMIERNLNNASVDNVIKICKILGITVESLVSQNAHMHEDRINGSENQFEMPLFSSIKLGTMAIDEPETIKDEQYINIPRKLLGKYGGADELFAVIVDQEDMNKTIPVGSIAVCKPIKYEDLRDGDVVVISFNNRYFLRRFRYIADEKVVVFRPESFKERYRDIEYQEVDAFYEQPAYAKVVWYSVILD